MPDEPEVDRILSVYLREVADEAAEHPQPHPGQTGVVIRHRAGAVRQGGRSGLAAVVFAGVAVALMVVFVRVGELGTSEPSRSGDATQGTGVESAPPDSNASVAETAVWVARARADALNSGIQNANALVPLAVQVGGGTALVWFRNYDTGSQVLAQYSDVDAADLRLIGVYAPSHLTVGPSQWETARITQAIAGDADLAAKVGRPVSILSVSAGECASAPGACARVRLAGSVLAAPSDGPGLAPIAFVNLRSLDVTLVLPSLQTPETKTQPPVE